MSTLLNLARDYTCHSHQCMTHINGHKESNYVENISPIKIEETQKWVKNIPREVTQEL